MTVRSLQLNGLFVGDCNGAGGMVVAQQVKAKMVVPLNPDAEPYEQQVGTCCR